MPVRKWQGSRHFWGCLCLLSGCTTHLHFKLVGEAASPPGFSPTLCFCKWILGLDISTMLDKEHMFCLHLKGLSDFFFQGAVFLPVGLTSLATDEWIGKNGRQTTLDNNWPYLSEVGGDALGLTLSPKNFSLRYKGQGAGILWWYLVCTNKACLKIRGQLATSQP